MLSPEIQVKLLFIYLKISPFVSYRVNTLSKSDKSLIFYDFFTEAICFRRCTYLSRERERERERGREWINCDK